MPPIPTYRDAREAGQETFKRLPVWFRDRAELREERARPVSERTEPFDGQLMVGKVTTLFNSDGRCYRKTTYTFFEYLRTVRTGTKYFRLVERDGDFFFVLGYLRTLERIARQGLADAIRMAAPDARATLVKAAVSAISGRLPGFVDAVELTGAVVKAIDTIDDLVTGDREVRFVLDWLGERVAQWVETDYLVEIFPRTITRRTYITEVVCDEDGLILGLPEGQEGFREREHPLPDDDQQAALGELLDPASGPTKQEKDRRIRELLDDIEGLGDVGGKPAKPRKPKGLSPDGPKQEGRENPAEDPGRH